MSQTPDLQWYYGQDGRERGPISQARLQELLVAGTLKPTDLVWHEGMKDWTPANKVEGLVPAAPPPPPAVNPRPPAPPTQAGGGTLSRFQTAVRNALGALAQPGSRGAQWLTISGIVLVVLARGCDSLGQRNVVRLAAKQAAATQQFEDEWETKRLGVQQKIDKLLAKTPATPEDTKTVAELRTQLTEMLKKQGEERKELKEGRWRDLEIAARNAKWDNDMSGYWHEVLFVLGAIAFTVGLILIGFGSQGPERWIALAMLAIIAYSLFVEGAAWMAVLSK